MVPRKLKIEPSVLRPLLTENLIRLTSALEEYDFSTRIVGGAVRDLILGTNPRDVDLATDASPIETMYICFTEGFEFSAGGIQHGTVVVSFPNGEEYEMTTLGFHIESAGRKISTFFEKDWVRDAARRDFTVNSLSMDLNGTVFDYTGGIRDVNEQRIRLLGDPFERISKDPKLILRFFKVLTSFTEPRWDKSIIHAMAENMDDIDSLSPRWVSRMLNGILNGKHPKTSIRLMKQYGFMKKIQERADLSEEEEEPSYEEEISACHNAMKNRRAKSRVVRNAYEISHAPFSMANGANDYNRK